METKLPFISGIYIYMYIMDSYQVFTQLIQDLCGFSPCMSSWILLQIQSSLQWIYHVYKSCVDSHLRNYNFSLFQLDNRVMTDWIQKYDLAMGLYNRCISKSNIHLYIGLYILYHPGFIYTDQNSSNHVIHEHPELSDLKSMIPLYYPIIIHIQVY